MENNKVVVVGSVSTGLANVIPGLFSDIDFNGLNNAIDALADNNTSLDKDQKDFAVEIVTNWQKDVVNRLYEKDKEMRSFLDFFNVDSVYHGYGSNGHAYRRTFDMEDDQMEIMAESTNTKKEYYAFIAARDALDGHNNNRPEEPDFDSKTTTYEERIIIEHAHEIKMIKFNAESKKLGRALSAAEKAWKDLMKQDAGVKEIIAKAKKFNKGLNGLISQAQQKSQLAKLNINISSKGIRDSLREMLDFTINI